MFIGGVWAMEEEEDASDPREGDEATGVVGDGEEDGGAEAGDIVYFVSIFHFSYPFVLF
jgi:hypothetical protein